MNSLLQSVGTLIPMVSEELVLDVPLIEVGTRLRRTPNSNDRFGHVQVTRGEAAWENTG